MDIKLIIIFVAAIVQLGLFWSYGKKAIFPFILALLVSLIWTAVYRYEYVGENFFLFHRINLYPLTLWTVGLTFLYLVHAYILRRLNYFNTAVLYLLALAGMEWVGYYTLGIRLTSHYSSLLGLGIIHAPLYMKVFYVVAGPIFILIAHIVRAQLKRNKHITSAATFIFGA